MPPITTDRQPLMFALPIDQVAQARIPTTTGWTPEKSFVTSGTLPNRK
jgi:hypothetical protein